MDHLLNWVTTSPAASVTLIALAVLLVVAGTLTYMVAFFQGREISFWPPKIGGRPALGKLRQTNESTEKPTTHVESTQNDTRNCLQSDGVIKKLNAPGHFEVKKALATLHLSSRPIAVLETIDGPTKGDILILGTGHRNIIVGADQNCDLPIESVFLSRQHFRLRITLREAPEQSGRVFCFDIIDSGSSNWRFLNGKIVSKPTTLQNGDLY